MSCAAFIGHWAFGLGIAAAGIGAIMLMAKGIAWVCGVGRD